MECVVSTGSETSDGFTRAPWFWCEGRCIVRSVQTEFGDIRAVFEFMNYQWFHHVDTLISPQRETLVRSTAAIPASPYSGKRMVFHLATYGSVNRKTRLNCHTSKAQLTQSCDKRNANSKTLALNVSNLKQLFGLHPCTLKIELGIQESNAFSKTKTPASKRAHLLRRTDKADETFARCRHPMLVGI